MLKILAEREETVGNTGSVQLKRARSLKATAISGVVERLFSLGKTKSSPKWHVSSLS